MKARVYYPRGAGCRTAALEEPEQPGRCRSARWTWRTGNFPGQSFTPSFVTGKGVFEGTPLNQKTIEVMFGPKTYTYIAPPEPMPGAAGS